MVRQLLFLEYLEAMLPADAADPKVVRQALDEISPKSPYWNWRMPNGWHIATLLRQAFETATQLDKHQEYASEVAEGLPDVESTVHLYTGLWYRTQHDLDSNFADRIYDRLRQLRPDHRSTKFIERQREFVGQVAPEFSVPSLEKPGSHYTDDDFRGKLYLIDSWATWCAPCVRDMPKLHQLYSQYQSQGFEILSYSLDSEEELRTFRREKWPMPWANSIEPEKGRDSEICKAYNVMTVPQPVLVGRDGKVLEIGEGFTADRLEAKLAQLLDQPKTLSSTAD